jgi:DNA modification methylase
MTVTIHRGDCRDVLRTLPDESVHCVVTSPPYFGLRDYGVAGQIGLEPTPEAFVSELVDVFAEVRRVLRLDGTVWLNLGDSYSSGGRDSYGTWSHDSKQATHTAIKSARRAAQPEGIKPKDILGIPWRVAFALQADGWYLRQDIIWSKPNPMPESVRDRCTKAHEYIFLLSKSERYYYDQDAILEPVAPSTGPRLAQNIEAQNGSDRVPGKTNGAMKAVGRRDNGKTDGYTDLGMYSGRAGSRPDENRNKRSVWEVTTQPFSEAHFATFPPALIEPCILAGCPKDVCSDCGNPWVRQTDGASYYDGAMVGSDPQRKYGQREYGRGPKNNLGTRIAKTIGFTPSCRCDAGTKGGTVLDPFGGAGTTGLVADRLGRNAVLIELNPEYAALAERRIKGDAPLFAEIHTQG